MVDPINLRQFRKRKKRQDKEAQADQNRKLHGIPTTLRKQTKQSNTLTERKLDGQRLQSSVQKEKD